MMFCLKLYFLCRKNRRNCGSNDARFLDMPGTFSMITKAGLNQSTKRSNSGRRNALSLFLLLSVLIYSRIGTDCMRQRLNDRRSSKMFNS